MPVHVGHVYKDAQFYADPRSGELLPKYFLVLAAPPRGDIVVRLLTSRYAGLRPESPPCFHGDPYAGFFLGVLGGALSARSWLDLRPTDDLDRWDLSRAEEMGRITEVLALPGAMFRDALECAAGADDTTRQQESSIRDVMAGIRRAR